MIEKDKSLSSLYETLKVGGPRSKFLLVKSYLASRKLYEYIFITYVSKK